MLGRIIVTDNLPVIVSGLGRCGSSMICQMLHMGGMRETGDAAWPMFEDSRSNLLPKKSEWMRGLGGMEFLKILNPYYFRPPKWFRCHAVWLNRDTNEQVKSWVKYGEAVRKFKNVKRLTPKQIRQIIKSRKGRGIQIMRSVAGDRLLILKFEQVLESPMGTAMKIENAFRKGLDLDAMANAVAPRDGKCLTGFLETENYKPGALL